MMSLGRNSLARDYSAQVAETSQVHDLPGLDDSSLLERFLSKLSDRIKSDGLNSLLWVPGVRTKEIANRLIKEIGDTVDGQQC